MRDAQKGRKSWLERLTSPPEADDESYPQDAVPDAAQQMPPGQQGPAPGQPGPGMPPGGPQFGPGPGAPPGQGPAGMPPPPDAPQGPPPGPMSNQDAFDPFAPPKDNGAEERSAFAMAFDENEDNENAAASGEPREPWEPRDTPEYSGNTEPRDNPEPRDMPEPTDTPPDRQPTPDRQRTEFSTDAADLDPFDVREDDAVVTSEHTAASSSATAGTPAPAGPPVTPTDRQPDPEPTDSPPWEREPRVVDTASFSDVTDTPTKMTDEVPPNQTDGSDETTFMSTVEEPVQTGPSEEEQLEAARKRHVEELQQRWLITQSQLLDDPRDAVREAGLLIGDAMQFVTTTFTEHRDRIEQEWKDNADMNTDELRAIMRRYRNLFQYVLSASQLPDL